MSRLVLYQWTQADVACSTSPSRASGPVRNGELSRTHSVLYSPMVVSASALSKASPTDPIDGVIPLFTLVGDAPTPTGLHWTVPLKGRSPGMTYATLGAGNGWLHPSRWAVGKIGGRISPDLERAVFSDQHAWKGRYSTPFGATDPAVHWMPQPFFGGHADVPLHVRCADRPTTMASLHLGSLPPPARQPFLVLGHCVERFDPRRYGHLLRLRQPAS
jgi:hypothetical protein